MDPRVQEDFDDSFLIHKPIIYFVDLEIVVFVCFEVMSRGIRADENKNIVNAVE